MKSIVVSVMLLIGCKGQSSSCHVTASGAWPQNSTVDVACGEEARQLACQPAATGAKTTECTCNSSGVIGKKATVEVTPGGILAGEPKGVIKAACGWE